MRIDFTRPGTVTNELLQQRSWSLENLRKVSFHNDDSWRAFTAFIDDRAVGAIFFERPELYPHRIEVDSLLILPEVDRRRVAAELFRALSAYAANHRVSEIACSGVDGDRVLEEFGFRHESETVVCKITQLALPADAPYAEAPRPVESATAPGDEKVTSKCGVWSGPRKYLARHEMACKRGCEKPQEATP